MDEGVGGGIDFGSCLYSADIPVSNNVISSNNTSYCEVYGAQLDLVHTNKHATQTASRRVLVCGGEVHHNKSV